MDQLKDFLDNVRIMKLKKLIIVQYGHVISFHVSGKPEDYKKIYSGLCSPNTVAEICFDYFKLDLSSDEIVKISNWIE